MSALKVVPILLVVLAWGCRGPGEAPVAGDAERAPGMQAIGTAEIDPPQANAVAGMGAEPNLMVQVLEVARISSGTVELRFALLNAGGAPLEFGRRFGSAPEDEGTIADVYLLDAGAERKYFVMRNADNQPLCSHGLEPLQPGERRELWARFAAPPETTQVSVHIPHFPPVGAIAVTSEE